MEEQDLQQLNSIDEPIEQSEAVTVTPQRKKLNKFVDVLLWVMIAVLAVAVLLRAFVFTQITVSGESMMQTYHNEDVVGVSKVKKLHRGDVVVFYKTDEANKFFDIFAANKSENDDGKYSKLIKRCVALAGDKLWVEKVADTADYYMVVVETPDGEKLYEDYYEKNGETLDKETFYVTGTLQTGSDLGELRKHIGEENALIIPENCFFAMGDNRSNSSDSRSFGAVPVSRLYGVVVKS